jgi:ADP-heptose:LPS heptosyltransferase
MPCLSWVKNPFDNAWNIRSDTDVSSVKPGTIGTCIIGPIHYSEMLADAALLLKVGGTMICETPEKKMIDKMKAVARVQIWQDGVFTIVRKLSGKNGLELQTPRKADPEKVQYVLRFGAFGDQLMMTPVIQDLYDKGKHIVYITNNAVFWKGDPRITELWEIPKHLMTVETYLEKYLPFIKEYCGDKLLNFTHVVENTLLVGEAQEDFKLPQLERFKRGCKPYFDHHFEYVGIPVPEKIKHHIHLSESEKEWAKNEVDKVRRQTGKNSVVLWNIFGSSFHKMYPWMFDVWKLCIMNDDDIAFIAIGDSIGGFATGFEFNKTVKNYATANMSIRKSLALHSAVDGVVTPETWSLTAVFAFDAPVVALMSHSHKSSFPFREKDRPLSAPSSKCPCHPCYQLHFSRSTCPAGKIEPAAVLCMDQIDPKVVYKALKEILYGDNADDIACSDQKVS